MSSSNDTPANSDGIKDSIGPADASTGADFQVSPNEPTHLWNQGGQSIDEPLESRFDTGLLSPSENKDALGRIGKYDLLSHVGQGAMGVVFRGFDVQLHRTVAIKVLNRGLASSPTARRRFLREARAAAGIHHDNVVTIHAVEEQPGCSYLVMEFVEGGTLRDRIRQQQAIPAVEAIRLSAQIAAGLAAAHAQGVIHRDIKPGNIMLEAGLDRAKLTDFGLARMAVDNAELTTEGVVLGTPSYMSPEQIRGEAIDARSDLFSLGCVMYAMLTGHAPFQGRHPYDISRRITDSQPLPPHEVDAKVPRFLSEMVMRLLEKDAEARYQSAAEVAEVLNRQMVTINQTPSDQLSKVLRSGGSFEDGRRLRKWLTWAAAGIALIVVLAFGMANWPGTTPVVRAIVPAVEGPDTGPVTAPAKLTVSQAGEADYATIQEALRHAGTGTRIVVLDDGEYEGAIVLDEPQRMSGIVLEAAAGARVSAPSSEATVLRIGNVSGVEVRGFQLDVKNLQHGVELRGACEGVLIERLQIHQEPQAKVASIFIHQSASGTAERPLTLRNLNVECGDVGIVIGDDAKRASAAAVRDVHLMNSRVLGPGSGSGVLLILRNSLNRVEVRDNVFAHGLTGLSINVPQDGDAQHVTIAGNTFYDLKHFLFYWDSSSDQQLRIEENLIAMTDGLFTGDSGLGNLPDAFAGNRWERSESLNTAHAELVAEVVDSIAFQSRDRGDEEYLKPASGIRP